MAHRKYISMSKPTYLILDGRVCDLPKQYIHEYITEICEKMNLTHLNVDAVVDNVYPKLKEYNTFNDINEQIIKSASDMVTIHYNYPNIATYILIDSLHDSTHSDYFEVVKEMMSNLNPKNEPAPLVSKQFSDYVEKNKDWINSILQPNYIRDYDITLFGYRTLEKAYLKKLSNGKIVERQQHMCMRVAIAIHSKRDDKERIKETYEFLSQGFFTHATPTLFNSGTTHEQLSSCFLLGTEDDMKKITKSWGDCGLISKHAGGIGITMTNVRVNGAYINSTQGTASGLRVLPVFNAISRYADQSGKRPGSIAVYLEPWHGDIFFFLDLKKNTGNETERTRDLFLALTINDIFMRRVESDGIWSLMCPHECPDLLNKFGDEFTEIYERYESEGKFLRQLPARNLWFKILESQIETGVPYMLFKDSVNKKSNQMNIGTINGSNLCIEVVLYSDANEYAVCFTADTEIITQNGIKKIIDCDNENVLSYYESDINLIKSEHFEKAKLISNGKKMVWSLKTSGNKIVNATEDHPFLVLIDRNTKNNKYQWKKLKDLKIDDRLIVPQITTLDSYKIDIDNFNTEYITAGWMIGDGQTSERERGVCFGPTETYAQEIVINQLNAWQQTVPISEGDHDKKVNVYVQPNGVVNWQSSKLNFKKLLHEKFGFKRAIGPNKRIDDKIKFATPKEQASFLSGYFSADGYVVLSGRKLSVNLSSSTEEILYDVQSMLTPFGIKSKIRFGEVKTRLGRPQGILSICGIINIDNFQKYINFKLCPNKINKLKDCIEKSCRKRILFADCSKVISIQKLGEREVYDLALPQSHNFIANGHVVHNCNLASICLPKFVDGNEFNYQKLCDIAKVATRNLDNIIDLNFYPVEKARISNMKHRPLGLGVQGLADVFAKLKIPFDSPRAREINKKIFETIYYGAISESCQLAKEYGPYSTYQGSPISKGIFQFDMWNIDRKTLMWDWDKLEEMVLQYGVRNSTTTAGMPTASSSQIMGNNECFEAFTSNVYTRSTIAGDYYIINKYLMQDLMDLGLWNKNMENLIKYYEGSIQDIPGIPDDIKEIYRCVWNIDQKSIIDMSADRGAFIDQTQSLNIFIAEPDFARLNSCHFHAWKSGLKTGMYYLRTKPASEPNKFGIDIDMIREIEAANNLKAKEFKEIPEEEPMKVCRFRKEGDNEPCLVCQ